MGNNIDERIVQMQFDNDDFNEGVQSSLKSLDKLDEGLTLSNSRRAVSDLNDVSNSISNLTSGFSNFTGIPTVIGNVTDAFDRLRYIVENTVISRFTNQIISAGEQMISSLSIDQVSAGWTKYADKTSAVQTIMAATAKDFSDTGRQMEFVNGQLDKLMWFTDETSYNFVDMVSNIGKFTSQGIDLETSVTAMQGIATWAAISGGNAQNASRAMYNLSQSLGLGSVRVQDWMSIENANMATVEFKEQVMETAVAMGTLQKVSDGVYKTIGKNGKEVTAASFRENLKDGWFTSRVLISTLENYGAFTDILSAATDETHKTATELLEMIDNYIEGTVSISDIAEETGLSAERTKELFDELSSSTYELGRRSFKAAQEAKTFQEAIDATKDAVSSQWMKTYEIVFGDYEEARKLWTGLANILWDAFAAGGEARNEALAEWREKGGRDAALEAAANAYEALASIAAVAKKAVETVFTPATGEQLADITKNVRDFTTSLKDMLWYEEDTKIWKEDSEKGTREVEETTWKMSDALFQFRRILQGAVSIIAIGVDAFKALGGGAAFVAKEVGKRSGGVIELLASFGDKLLDLRNRISQNNVFGQFVDKFKPTIHTLITWFSITVRNLYALGGEIIKFLNPSGVFSKVFESFNGTFNSFVQKLPAHIRKFGLFINGFITSLRSSKTIQNLISGFVTTLSGLRNSIKNIFTSITGYSNFGDFFIVQKQKILESVNAFKQYISENQIFEKVIGRLKRIGTSLTNNLGFIFTSLKLFAYRVRLYLAKSGIINKIFEAFSSTFGRVVSAISPYLIKFREFISNFIDSAEGTTILEKIFNVLGSKISAFRTKISEFLSSFSSLSSVGAKFKAAIAIVKTAITSFFNADTSGAESFMDKIKKRLEAFAPITAWFGRMVQNIKQNWVKDGGLLMSAFNAIANAYKFIFDAISGIFSWFRKIVAGKDINIFTILKAYFSLKTAGAVMSTFLNLKWTAENIWEVVEGVKNAFNNFTGGALSWQESMRRAGNAILKIAVAIGIIALAIYGLSTVDPVKLTVAIGVVAGIGFLLYEFSKVLTESFKDRLMSRNLVNISKSFTKIGVALILLSLAMKIIASMNLTQIGNSLMGIGGLLMELAIFVNYVPKNANTKIKGLIGLSVSVLILVQAMKQIASMDLGGIVKGLIGVGVLLLELAAFMRITQGEIFKTKSLKSTTKMFGFSQGIGLLAVVFGIVLLVKAMKEIATLDVGGIIKGLIGVGVLLLELAAFMRITQSTTFLDKNLAATTKMLGFSQGIGLLAVVFGIVLLVKAMKEIATLDVGGIIKGLVGVGVLMLELIAFAKKVGSIKYEKGSIIALLGLGASLLLFVEVVKRIADISSEGLVKGIVGLGAIMIELALVMKSMSKLGNVNLDSVVLAIGLSAAMLLIADAFLGISEVPFSGIIKGIIAFSSMFLAIKVFSKSISSGVNILGTIVLVVSIGIALHMMVKAINSLANVGLDKTIGVAATLSAMFLAIAGTFKLMSGIGIGGTISAALSLAVAIAAVAAIVAAAGAIAQIPGFDWIIGEGARALGLVGSAIGTFIGGIVGGFGAGVSLGFPIIGQNLSDFMNNAQDFFTGLDGVTDEKVSAVGKLVDLIVKLTAAELLSGISSFVTGGADISGFAAKLPLLGEGIASFATSVSGLDESAVTAGTNAGLAITGLVDALPPTGGWMQKITGEVDVEGFASSIPTLGAGIKGFADAVVGMDSDAATNATNAGLAIAGLVDSLPPTSGWMQKITGEANIEGFASSIPTLGVGIKGFGDAISGMDADAAVNGANAGLAIAGLVDALPPSEGWMQKITGEADIEGFADKLPILGQGIKGFADAVTGLDADVATNATNVGVALNDLATNLPKENGLAQAIFGSQSLGSFSDDIVTFGTAVSSYMDSVSGFTDSDAESSKRIVDTLLDLSSRIPKTGGISAAIFGSEDLGTFSTNIGTFANSISSYGSTISTVDTTKMDAVSTQVQKIIDLSNAISGNNTKKIKNNLAGIVDAFVSEGVVSLINAYDFEGQFSDAGTSFVGYIINSMELANEQFSTTGTNSANAFLNAISPSSEAAATIAGSNLASAAVNGLSSVSAYHSGIGFVQGFINGMAMKKAEAATMAASIGESSLSGLNGAIEVNSPSKATKRSGKWFGEGYISMLSAYRDKAYYESQAIGKESVSGINSGINGVSSIYDILDIRPTITPVLDLSEIEAGSNYISSILNPYSNTGYGLNFGGPRIPRMVEASGYSIPYLSDNKEVVDAVKSLGSKLDSLNEDIRNLKLVMDTGVVAGQMVGAMDKEFGKRAMYKGRGN